MTHLISSSVSSAVCVVVVVAATLAAAQSTYDAMNYPCNVYHTCPEDQCGADGNNCGACDEGAGQYGPMCQVANAGATCPACTPGNTVTTDGTDAGPFACLEQDVCICRPGYTGDDCSQQRVDVSCSVDAGITVTVKPYLDSAGGFDGFIILGPSQDNDALFHDDVTCRSATGAIEYERTIAPDDTSACAVSPVDDVYTVYAYIQYKNDYRLIEDELYQITCSIAEGAQPGENTNTIQIATVLQEDISGRDPALSTFDVDGAFSMIIRGGEGEAGVPDPLGVGDDLSLVIQNPQLFSIKSCTGYNYDPEGEVPAGEGAARSVDLIVNWCVPNAARVLVRDAIGYLAADTPADQLEALGGVADEHLARIPLNAWYFLGASADIWLQCVTCIGSDGSCDYTVAACENNLMEALRTALEGGSRRRRHADESALAGQQMVETMRVRRQADGQSEDDVGVQTTGTLSVSVTVNGKKVAGTDTGVDTEDGDKDNTDCYSRISVILPIILLAVLLLVAMVMTFFFCLKVTRMQERGEDGQVNMAYKS